ncbi:MAG: hypothetical protein F6K24_20755 [Okeania sp. SIO2D1]|nr:hypothetical protein [Okeania sp. SIO2D1]
MEDLRNRDAVPALVVADLSELIDNLQIQELNNLVKKKIIRYVVEQVQKIV